MTLNQTMTIDEVLLELAVAQTAILQRSIDNYTTGLDDLDRACAALVKHIAYNGTTVGEGD